MINIPAPADAMHVFFVHGVANKVMGILLFQMCILRKDLPGTSIPEQVDSVWEFLRQYYLPHSPPIKKFTEQTFRSSQKTGIEGASFNAKAKETWDMWAGVYALVLQYCKNDVEITIAKHFNCIMELMGSHSLDDMDSQKWLTAELDFLGDYINAGFPATPKFHLMQHIFLQFQHDCAPRYASPELGEEPGWWAGEARWSA